ncbi:MAG: hypothetical protein V4857_00640 [Pseudomonadota bacterium]
MPEINHPSKDQVRAYLQRRSRAVSPPPSPEAIRRELGWNLASPQSKSLPIQS